MILKDVELRMPSGGEMAFVKIDFDTAVAQSVPYALNAEAVKELSEGFKEMFEMINMLRARVEKLEGRK